MTEFLIPITVNTLPAISDLQGKQGMFILPDGSININKKDGTWFHINKQSDHAGVLKPSDNVSVQPGIAKWYWAGAGTYNNVGGIIINKLGVLSYDGQKWGEVNVDIPSVVSPTFDPVNAVDPQGAKQINSWLVNDVKGGESDETKIYNEVIGAFYKKAGIELNGTGQSSIQSGLYDVISNSTCVADANKFVTTANIRLAVAGVFRYCIGKWDGTKFNIRWESETINGVQGWNVNDYTSMKLKVNAGEQLSIKCLSSSTAQIYYGDPGAPNNRFQQFSSTGNAMAQANFGSYFCVWFELKDIDLIPVESNAVFNLSKSVSNIVLNFATNGYEGLESTLGESVVSTDSDADSGYAINRIELNSKHLLEKLEIRTITAGTYNIAIGFLEQTEKFIEKVVITKTLNAGLNTVFFEKPILLLPKDFVGLKFPSKYPVNNSPTEANLWATSSYTGVLTAVPGKSLPLKLFLKEYIESPIATKAELIESNGKIASLQQNFVRDGKKVILKFNTDGTTSWEFNEGFDKFLVIGNSFAIHPITVKWWGLYGMAASKRENDYAHRILTKMKVYKPSAVMNVINLSAWEVDPVGYNKSLLDADLVGQKFIPIRLGENASFNSMFEVRFGELIDYIISKVPTAKLSIGGVFWADENKDAAMKAVADARNIPFVKMSDLDIPENRSAIGNQVMGDDNQLHSVNDSGVAMHAGDKGHDLMADRTMAAIGL